MIILRKYGLALHSMQANDLEMVRRWRNSDNVRAYFEYQKIISEKEQIEWYSSLDPAGCIYFIIYHQGIPCGVVSLKEINWHAGQAEAGIFMADEIYVRAYIPVTAVIILMEISFNLLELKQLSAKIHEDNVSAIKFNLALGYRKMFKYAGSKFANFQVDENHFQEYTKKFINTLQKRYGQKLTVNFNEEDIAVYPSRVIQKFMTLRGIGTT